MSQSLGLQAYPHPPILQALPSTPEAPQGFAEGRPTLHPHPREAQRRSSPGPVLFSCPLRFSSTAFVHRHLSDMLRPFSGTHYTLTRFQCLKLAFWDLKAVSDCSLQLLLTFQELTSFSCGVFVLGEPSGVLGPILPAPCKTLGGSLGTSPGAVLIPEVRRRLACPSQPLLRTSLSPSTAPSGEASPYPGTTGPCP